MRVCPKCFAQESEDARFCGLCGTKLFEVQAAENSSLVGLVLKDQYKIQKRIAVGGMGEVYLATHMDIGQKVAVKILNRRFQGDETVVRRFVNEARSYTLVTHPNAVKLHDFGRLDDGTFFIIMEFVQGETLTQHMARVGPLPHRQLLAYGTQLADVLLAAHNQGVVHRDLKPDNLMLQEPSPGRFQVKVLDFGIAKLVGETGGQLTEAGMVFGTPEFMSPEQAQGIEVDHRTDIYAFGMLLYYMSTYRLPFEGVNKLAVLNKQVHDRPARPSEFAPDIEIDPGLEALIMTCLRKAQGDRYENFGEVLEDLELIASGARPKLAGHTFPDDDTTLPDYISLDDDTGHDLPTSSYGVSRNAATDATVNIGGQAARAASDPLQAMFDRALTANDEITIVASPDSDPELAVIAREAVAERERDFDDEITKLGSRGSRHASDHSRGPTEDLSPAANLSDEAYRFGDEPDNDAFSLGDSLDVDHDDDNPHRYGQKRGGGGVLGVVIVLALVGLAVGAWLMTRSGEQGSQALEEESPRPVVVTPDVITPELAPTDVQSAISEQPDVVDAPPVIEPLPASVAISSEVRRGALVRTMLKDVEEKLVAGEIDDGFKMLGKTRKLGPVPVAHEQRLAALEGSLTGARDILKEGKRQAARLRCADVSAKAIELQELSPGAANTLTGLVESCKRQLAAPPSRVD